MSTPARNNFSRARRWPQPPHPADRISSFVEDGHRDLSEPVARLGSAHSAQICRASPVPFGVPYAEHAAKASQPRARKSARPLTTEPPTAAPSPSTEKSQLKACALPALIARPACPPPPSWSPGALPPTRPGPTAIPHPVAEAVKGGSVPPHAVAVQCAVREAEIVRRVSKNPLSSSPMLFAPFDFWVCLTFRAAGTVPPTRDHAGRRTREGQANGDGAARAFKTDGQGKSCIGLPFGPMHAFPRDSAVTGPHYMPVPSCCASGRKPAEAILVAIAIPPDTASSMPSIHDRTYVDGPVNANMLFERFRVCGQVQSYVRPLGAGYHCRDCASAGALFQHGRKELDESSGSLRARTCGAGE